MRTDLRRGMGMLWCLVLLLVLVACSPAGGSTSADAPVDQPSATAQTLVSPTAGAPTPNPASQKVNGCSTAPPPTGAQKQADRVVSQGGTRNEQVVTLNQGQTLEVRLPAQVRWHLQIENTGSALGTTEATGWYNATLKACLWRFSAVETGTATLSFAGTVICEPKGQCPVAALTQQYNVTVRKS